MIIKDLVLNLSLLISVSVFSEFIERAENKNVFLSKILEGLLFGLAAVISMSFAYVLYDGVIFDGRSVAISISALFFGPIAGLISTLAAVAYRLELGGTGTAMGLIFSTLSYVVGIGGHYLQKRHSPEWLTYTKMYLFGLTVHATGLISVFALPASKIVFTLKHIGPSFLIIYPVGTLLIGAVLKGEEDRQRMLKEIKESESLFRTTLYSIGDGVISTDASGKVMHMNRVAEELTGWKEFEARGLWLGDIFNIVNEKTREKVENPLARVVKEGIVVGLANHTLLISRDGREIPIADSGAPITGNNTEINGMVLVFRDQTDERRARKLVEQSERKMRAIVEGTPHLFFYVQNKNGDLTYISPSVERITGYTVEEWLARRDWFITDNPVNSVARRKTHEHLSLLNVEFYRHNWRPDPILIEILHKDGHKVWLEVYESPIIEDEKVVGLHGVAHDITERLEANRKLKESEERFRGLAEEIPAAVWIHDFNRFIYANPAAVELTGYSLEELHQMYILDLIHPDFKEKVQSLIERRKSENYRGLEEFKIVTKKGEERWVNSTAAVIEMNGKPTIIASWYDITESKKLNEQLIRSQRLESIGTLASGIAHDLNNIFGIIVGNAQLVKRAKGNTEKVDRSMSAIENAAKRGASLVKQLLSFAGKTVTEFEAVNVNSIVGEVVELVKETFPKTIQIETELDSSLPVINADPVQIHQILLNLSVNARDAMPEGGKLRISTALLHEDQLRNILPHAKFKEYVKIEVADTGIGMDDVTKSKIFEPFFTTKGVGKGTGLGLSVVFGAIRKHEGFIHVDSKLNEGTVFRVYLPVGNQFTQVDDSKTSEAGFNTGFDEDETIEEQYGSGTVLVVEDEEMLRQLLTDILSSNGYNVICVEDGQKAIEKYREFQNEIEIVLTDYGLPVINGREVAREIKGINPEAKIIIASGYIDPEEMEELLELGINEIIQKPYFPDDILSKLKKALKSRI